MRGEAEKVRQGDLEQRIASRTTIQCPKPPPGSSLLPYDPYDVHDETDPVFLTRSTSSSTSSSNR
jgi:hypothetical protein